MQDIFEPLRAAYYTKLASLTYLGQSIPVNDEELYSTPAILPVGNSTGIQAYVLIQNQSLQDSSAQCCINQDTQLQLAVRTLFPAGVGNAGGYLHADRLSQVILDILFPFCSNTVDIQLDNLDLWRGWLENSTHVFEQYKDGRAFSKILILNHSIFQPYLTT